MFKRFLGKKYIIITNKAIIKTEAKNDFIAINRSKVINKAIKDKKVIILEKYESIEFIRDSNKIGFNI